MNKFHSMKFIVIVLYIENHFIFSIKYGFYFNNFYLCKMKLTFGSLGKSLFYQQCACVSSESNCFMCSLVLCICILYISSLHIVWLQVFLFLLDLNAQFTYILYTGSKHVTVSVWSFYVVSSVCRFRQSILFIFCLPKHYPPPFSCQPEVKISSPEVPQLIM